nr:MAG TPA: hypothetical protein [Caudoviricetes sp.]
MSHKAKMSDKDILSHRSILYPIQPGNLYIQWKERVYIVF